MANRRKSRLDMLRTQTWARYCALSLGERKGNALERTLLLRAGRGSAPVSGSWEGYLRGTNTPYSGWAPIPNSSWASLARQVCPGSWGWFATPFWYLLEDEHFTPQQLVDCASVLPLTFREHLLHEPDPSLSHRVRPGLLLREQFFEWQYVFTDPLNAWSLGGSACAMRRAELAGSGAEMRWAAVALVWQLEQFIEMFDAWGAEPFAEARDMLLKRFEHMIYLDGVQLPIRAPDVKQFDEERAKFLRWKTQDFTEPGVTSWPPSRPIVQGVSGL